MKTVLLTAALAISSIFATHAQLDLEFDNTFNGGNPFQDGYTNIAPDYDYSDYGRMKKLNDSMFVYYVNSVNWMSQNAFSEAIAVVSHTDGSVEHLTFYNLSYSFSGSPEDYFITDLIVNPINEQVFVVKNGIYSDGAINRRCVLVYGYQYDGIGTAFPNINNWGENQTGVIQISLSGTDMYGAKGTLLSGVPYLAFNASGTQSANVVLAAVIQNGQGFSTAYATSNAVNLYSQVVDLIVVSTTEVYIADNAYVNYGNGTYADNNRILKWNPSVLQLDQTYGAANGMASITWSTPGPATTFLEDHIKRIYYDGGKLLVAGYIREDIGAPYTPTHGKVTRLNNNGSADNTFGTNGTFGPDFSADRFRTYFNDIDKSSDGSIYLSGSGSVNDSPNDPNECFILAINDVGTIQTGKGNNGFLFETIDYSEIVETIIVPGASALTDKFIFNGMKVINPDPQMYEQETAVGRLVWNNGTTATSEDLQNAIFSCYPNPATTVLTIEATEETNISMVNISGATVAVQTLHTGVNNMDVSHLSNGIYFIHSDAGGVVKWIKE